MAASTIRIELDKLLGFRLIADTDLSKGIRLGGKIGDKRGEKPTDPFVKLGAKVGGKVGRKG